MGPLWMWASEQRNLKIIFCTTSEHNFVDFESNLSIQGMLHGIFVGKYRILRRLKFYLNNFQLYPFVNLRTKFKKEILYFLIFLYYNPSTET